MPKKKVEPDDDYSVKEQKAGLFDILKNICESEENRWHEFEKSYIPFLINRFLSMSPDLVHLADTMNKSSLDKREQYEFLLATVPKRRRYLKYQKANDLSELEEEVQETLKVNRIKARGAAKILKSY